MIKSAIVPSASLRNVDARHIGSEFRDRLEAGDALCPAGSAKRNPESLLSRAYLPRACVELCDTTFYLSGVRQNPDIRFFVGFVVPPSTKRRKRIYPRIFYKDVSLIWRSASHYIRSADENWIGKGDVRAGMLDGEPVDYSDETTTDLPLEIQTALEELSRTATRVPRDDSAVDLVLRRAPDHRIRPYYDFTAPRRRAWADPRNRINGGRMIARVTKANDPTSARFVSGYEPDFRGGIVERSRSRSKLYGGNLRRYRIVSKNRRVQYLFFAGPRQVWIVPPQATTTEFSSYGVRTVDVHADEDVFLPGYEYHFMDDSEDPPALFSQIPKGFVGPVSPHDASRCSASPWIDKLPVVRDFRRIVLGQKARR